MDVKILEDRSEGCEIHIHCQSREDKEVKAFFAGIHQKRIPALPSTANFPAQTPPRFLREAVEGSVFQYTADQVSSPLFPLSFLERIWGRTVFPLREKRGSKPAADRTAEKPTGGRLLFTLSQRRKYIGKPALSDGTAPPTGRL